MEYLSRTFYQNIRKKKEITKPWDFNDMFNTLVRCFPKDLKPPKASILKLYISTMKDLYGALIRERHTTLFEALERECEIE
jgi:hypothetical protein